MKSEHRHELKENELGKAALQARAALEKYGNQLLLGLVALLLLFGGWMWWSSSSASSAAEGWLEFQKAGSAEDYANVAEKFPRTAVAQWAKLNEGEMYLNTGLPMAFTDRAAAVKELKKAEEAFKEVLNGSPLPDDMRERALAGLARTLEINSGRDTAPAIAIYEQLIKDFPNSPHRVEAEQRIKDLKKPQSQEFYGWFQAQNPKPEDLKGPQDGLPSGHPPFTPPTPGETTEAPAEAETPADAPKPDDSKPDDSKPDDSKPDDSKPDDSKPDDSKPDAPKPDAPKPDDSKPENSKPSNDSRSPESSKPGSPPDSPKSETRPNESPKSPE